jgi:ABC-type multidrug transport system permease subunit
MRQAKVIAAIVRKDLAEWLRQPRQIVFTLMPSIVFILLLAVSVTAVGQNKVALVVEDNGPHARQLADNIRNYNAFLVTDANAEQAAQLFKDLQVEAVVTIPAGFEAAYLSQQPDPVRIQVNNLNLDFTNDLRRSLPAAIGDFYAQQPDSPIAVTPAETDLRSQDVSLFQYMLLPLLIQLLTMAGVVNTSLNMSREWETQTMKEIVLAPIHRSNLVVAKIVSGWIIAMVFGGVSLLLATLAGYFHPVGIYWLTSVLTLALVALFSVGVGVALAALLRKQQPVTAASMVITFYLFFLSGGITVAAFLPDWVKSIAQFIPTSYGVHALQMAVFYSSSDLLPRDILVLLASTGVALVLGVWAMRRRLLA